MKSARHSLILEIIEEKDIETQEELAVELKRRGIKVTQATVSRDIKELRLLKGRDGDGNYRYLSPAADSTGGNHSNARYAEMVNHSVIDVKYALNDVVIKCYNGMAQSVCIAVEALFNDKMLGTIAGDDTILAVVHSETEAETLTSEIKALIGK